MIKGLYFSKYLKLSLIGFGISCFMVLGVNSVNAEWLRPGQYSDMAGGDNSCTIGSDLGIRCTSSSNVLANTFGPGIGTALSSLFWSSDGIGIHYVHDPEGFEDRSADFLLKYNFHVCSGDVSIGSISGFTQGLYPNCVANGYEVVGDYTYQELMTKLSTESLQYRGNFTSTNAGVQLQLVFETFYFSVWVNGYGTRNNDLFNGTGNSTNFGFGTGDNYSSVSFTNSNVISNPLGGYAENDGSSNGVINSTITGDYVYATCTYDEIFILLESEGYNKYQCYGGLDNFDLYDSSINYKPIPGSGLSLNQIWSYPGNSAWDTFEDWYWFRGGLYSDKSNNNYDSMRESYPAIFRTWFELLHTYDWGRSGSPTLLFNYCLARDMITGSALGNNAGGYFKQFCQQVVQEKQTGVWDTRLNGTIYSGGIYTGDDSLIPIGVNWGSGVQQKDSFSFIQDYFNKAKSVIPTNYPGSGNGFLPGYIILFMCALILFRFLSH